MFEETRNISVFIAGFWYFGVSAEMAFGVSAETAFMAWLISSFLLSLKQITLYLAGR